MSKEIHVYCIGSDGTEIYAAHSEAEMKTYYRKMMGATLAKECEEDLANNFDEIKDIDSDFEFDDEGKKVITSWRKLAEQCDLPNQLSTGYN